MSKKTVFLFWAAVLGSIGVFNPQPLEAVQTISLNDALNKGLQNPTGTYQTAVQSLQLSNLQQELTEAGHGFKYTVSGGAGLTDTWQEESDLTTGSVLNQNSQYTATIGAAFSRPFVLGSTFGGNIGYTYIDAQGHETDLEYNPALSLNYIQPLSWDAIESNSYVNRSGKRQIEQAKLSLDAAKSTMIQQILTQYIQLYLAQRQMDLQKEQLAYFRKTQEVNLTKIKLGMTAEYEKLEIEASILQNEYTIQVSRQNLVNTVKKFNLLIGWPVSESLQLKALPKIVINLPTQIDWDQAVAADNSIQRAKMSLKDAEMAIKQAHATYAPSLTISGTLSDMDTITTIGNIGFLHSQSGSIQGNVSVPIFYGPLLKPALDSAQLSYKQARANYEQQLIDKRIALQTAYDQCMNGNENLKIAQKSLALQKKLMEIADIKYRNGSIASTDLIQARNTLTQAQITTDQTAMQTLQSCVVIYSSLNSNDELLAVLTE